MNQHYHWILDFAWLSLLLALTLHFWRVRKNLLRARFWLKTKGQITQCELVDEGGARWPSVEYEFRVNDQEVKGSHLLLDTAHNTASSAYARGVAYRAAVAFKEGQDIDIYYNPNDPSESALDVSIPWKLNGIFICLLLLSVGQILRMVLIFWG